jgi:hypothetical protein
MSTTNEQATRSDGYTCPTCDKTFGTTRAFKEHRVAVHLGPPRTAYSDRGGAIWDIGPGGKRRIISEWGFKKRGEARLFIREANREFPATNHTATLTRAVTSPARTGRAPRPAGRSRRARPPSSDDPDLPLAPRPCEGCGDPLELGARPNKKTHGGACRKRKFDRLARAAVEVVVCPSCGSVGSRLHPVTGWCGPCTRLPAVPPPEKSTSRSAAKLRKEIEQAVQRRQEIWLELPSANGSHRDLAEQVRRLTSYLDGALADLRRERARKWTRGDIKDDRALGVAWGVWNEHEAGRRP